MSHLSDACHINFLNFIYKFCLKRRRKINISSIFKKIYQNEIFLAEYEVMLKIVFLFQRNLPQRLTALKRFLI